MLPHFLLPCLHHFLILVCHFLRAPLPCSRTFCCPVHGSTRPSSWPHNEPEAWGPSTSPRYPMNRANRWPVECWRQLWWMMQHAKYGNCQTLSTTILISGVLIYNLWPFLSESERHCWLVVVRCQILSLMMVSCYTCVDFPKQVLVEVDWPCALHLLPRSIYTILSQLMTHEPLVVLLILRKNQENNKKLCCIWHFVALKVIDLRTPDLDGLGSTKFENFLSRAPFVPCCPWRYNLWIRQIHFCNNKDSIRSVWLH